MRTKSGVRVLVVVAAAVLAGCGSRVTAPSDRTFDVTAAGRANATVSSLVSGSGMSGVAALSGRMPAELGPASVFAGAPMPGVTGVPALALRLLRSLPGTSGPLAVQVIRPSVLGHTYVYDPGSHRYVPDLARAGAPANGVRFILYAVDPGSHEPSVGHETGYADLEDDHPAGLGVGLHFVAIASGKTFLDYHFTLDPTFTGGSLRASGFLADDQNRLDFMIGAAGQIIGPSQTAQVTFDLAIASQQFHAAGAITSTGFGTEAAAQVDVQVAIGSDVLHLTGQSVNSTVDVRLSVNGRLFATISGDAQHPVVRGDGGRELTPAEIQTLGGLVGVIYGAIDMFEHLLEPIAVLLGISILL